MSTTARHIRPRRKPSASRMVRRMINATRSAIAHVAPWFTEPELIARRRAATSFWLRIGKTVMLMLLGGDG